MEVIVRVTCLNDIQIIEQTLGSSFGSNFDVQDKVQYIFLNNDTSLGLGYMPNKRGGNVYTREYARRSDVLYFHNVDELIANQPRLRNELIDELFATENNHIEAPRDIW